MVDSVTVESALATLRPSLAADGFELRVGDICGDRIQVILAAKPEACLDCLVPEEMMVAMVGDAIRDQTSDATHAKVELIKEGFDLLTDR